MTHHLHRMRTAIAACSVALLGLSGCTTLPRDSAPQVLRPFSAPAEQIEIPTPRADVPADVVLRDFFAATAHPTNNYAAARAFMTDELAQQWQPTETTRIVDALNLIVQDNQSADRQDFSVRATGVGLLGRDGAYVPATDSIDESVKLVKNADGQWRISQLPNGTMIERQTFLDNNAPRNLYFVDPSGNQLVADRRWIYRGVERGVIELLDKLRAGPSAPLTAGVTTVLPAQATIDVDSRDTSGTSVRTIRIDNVGDISPELRVLLVAQIVWTLANADYRGPWEILVDGQVVVPEHTGPWTQDSDELRPFDPTRVPADAVPLRTMDANGVYEIVGGQANPLSRGWASSGSRALSSAAIGIDTEGNEIVAAVSRESADEGGESTLLLGLANGNPSPQLTAKSFTRPTWSPDASAVWTVRDNSTVLRIQRSDSTSRPSTEEVDTSELEAFAPNGELKLTEFRVDSSGTQAAMIENNRVIIATINRSESAPWKLVAPRELPLPDGTEPVALTWSANQTVTVGTYSAETPLARIYPDGATTSLLPKLNLSPPVSVVASTTSKLYVTDTNALMELISGEGEDQFWRAVAGASGRMAPVAVE